MLTSVLDEIDIIGASKARACERFAVGEVIVRTRWAVSRRKVVAWFQVPLNSENGPRLPTMEMISSDRRCTRTPRMPFVAPQLENGRLGTSR